MGDADVSSFSAKQPRESGSKCDETPEAEEGMLADDGGTRVTRHLSSQMASIESSKTGWTH